MSTIRVHDIEGISTYSNTVRVPSGHTLDIDGDLRLPVYTTATLPGSGTEGQMVYDSSTKSIKVWNGNAWTAAGVTQSGDGSSENSPGTSAAAILASNPSSSTGFYWIKNDDNLPSILDLNCQNYVNYATQRLFLSIGTNLK